MINLWLKNKYQNKPHAEDEIIDAEIIEEVKDKDEL